MTIAQLKPKADSLTASPQRLIERTAEVVGESDRILALAKSGVRQRIQDAGGVDAAQHAAHGLAWLATTVESLRQMNVWASNLHSEGKFGEIEQLILLAAFAEYGAQIAGGIPMSQVEIIRPDAMGIPRADIRRYEDATADVIAEGSSEYVKQRLADLIETMQGATTYGHSGLDETHAEIAEQMKSFSDAEVVPHAHEWHLKNDYIPLETYKSLADLGVFSISLPEEYGGMGLGKLAMCVVSE
jgi:(2S)-methylsuccinyl-CoA dehydrogenase